MRAVAASVLASVIVLGAWACGTDAGDDSLPPDDGEDASKVDLAYCTRYCDAQANAGTLAGSRSDCVKKCCGNRAGCAIPDGGLPPLRDGGDEADGRSPDGGCAVPCGAACCASGEACHSESGGPPACVKACAKGADCSTGCCAPATNEKGDPVGPYVCKANDGKPYHCCKGVFTTCGADGIDVCCVTDAKGNEFCAEACDSNSQCGAGRCVGYTFGTLTTTCKGPTACGP